ncbi:hypothetical protein FKB34_05730 [Glycocaulis profundi]|nr:hypothetical protein FKB34_05730 [Glycocaulis profundi]
MTLDALRDRIAALEGAGRTPSAVRKPHGALPAPAILPGVHEVAPRQALDTGAATVFLLGLALSGDRDGRLVWVRARGAGSDFGRPCPEGMALLGLDPDQVLLAETREANDRLWAAEEAVRAGADVLLETAGIGAYGLVASRRLLLAAQSQGRRVLALRPRDAHAPTAAVCRWRISAVPGVPAPWRGAGGLKGLAAPRLRAELVRARGAAPALLELEWRNGAFRVAEPALLAHSEARSEGPARIAG